MCGQRGDRASNLGRGDLKKTTGVAAQVMWTWVNEEQSAMRSKTYGEAETVVHGFTLVSEKFSCNILQANAVSFSVLLGVPADNP